jgi:hypothetical protein
MLFLLRIHQRRSTLSATPLRVYHAAWTVANAGGT